MKADVRQRSLAAAFAAALCAATMFAGLTFIPDSTFTGSSLTGWHPLGDASWKAQSGEIIGTVATGGNGGWLMLDRSYQDVGIHAMFRCAGGCQAGIMI